MRGIEARVVRWHYPERRGETGGTLNLTPKDTLGLIRHNLHATKLCSKTAPPTGQGPDARRVAKGLASGLVTKKLTDTPSRPLLLSHPGSPSAHPTPALVAQTQGGITPC